MSYVKRIGTALPNVNRKARYSGGRAPPRIHSRCSAGLSMTKSKPYFGGRRVCATMPEAQAHSAESRSSCLTS